MLSKALNKNLERQRHIAREVYEFGEAVIEGVFEGRRKLSKYLCLQGTNR